MRNTLTIVLQFVDSFLDRDVYVPCNPVTIKVGMMVEVQLSFCTVPISKGRHIMLSKLRSVCILDKQVYKVSHCPEETFTQISQLNTRTSMKRYSRN